jgi:hypothetical protein
MESSHVRVMIDGCLYTGGLSVARQNYRPILTGLVMLTGASALAKAWTASLILLMLLLAVLAHRARLSRD